MDRIEGAPKAIFIEALEREPGAERAAFLDLACGDNLGLRNRVEALLRAHERADEVLGPDRRPTLAATALMTADPGVRPSDHPRDANPSTQQAVEPRATTSETDRQDPLSRASGTQVHYFGDYEIVGGLGRGGMGVVYRARQVKLNRPVALKMIRSGLLADKEELRRFRNEAEAVAMLDHPGIVPVYEIGEHEGQNYISMKLIEGNSLAEARDRYRADPKAAARLVAEAAEAVAHAHSRGILHRDLKPTNLLVDLQGRPHVTDFGLAKRVEGDSEMTLSGAILGTPAYMSPEQASALRGGVTTATDVYGLGAILYALLTGKAPFSGESVIETLDAVRNRSPEPPTKLEATIPRDLETICLKCLEKDPRRRYASAQALSDDLRAWLDFRPISARRVGAVERAWLWCKRRPAIAALAASVLLATLLGLVAVIAVWTEDNRLLENKNADLQASNIRLDAQRARAEDREAQAIKVMKRFRDSIFDEPELKNTPRLDGLRKRLLKEPLAFFQTLRDQLQADSDTRPESLARLAQVSQDLGLLTEEIGNKEDALIAYRESLAIRQKLAEANPSNMILQKDLAYTHTRIGQLLIPAGKLTEAMKAFEPALAISQKLADANPNSQEFQAQLAAAYRCFFLFHSSVENWGQAKKANQSALEILQKLSDANPTTVQFANDLATCYLNRALAISNTEASDETLRAYQAAVAINRKLVDADPSNAYHQDRLAFTMYAMGIVWMNLKNEAEATKLYESAQAIQEKVVADNPSITEFLRHLGLIYNNLAIMMGMKGETVEAMKKLQSAAAVHEKLVVLNPSVAIHHLDLANDYLNLGGLKRMDGKPAEAIKFFESAQAICQKLSEDKPDFSESEVLWNKVLVEMVKADLAAKRNQEADERLRQAVDRHQRFFTVDPTNPTHRRYLADNLERRIMVCRILGDWLGLSESQSRLSELRRSDPENPALDARLAAIIQGNQQPNRESDRVKLAKRADDQALYATAARLWGEVLEANPALKNDGLTQYPYRAARSAALAGCGAGKDHLSRDVSAQPKLRGQAREWLKANLATLEQNLDSDPTQVNPFVANTLQHWLQDANLAGIRDEDQLAKLPEAERKEWQSLWAEVEKLKKRAERPTH